MSLEKPEGDCDNEAYQNGIHDWSLPMNRSETISAVYSMGSTFGISVRSLELYLKCEIPYKVFIGDIGDSSIMTSLFTVTINVKIINDITMLISIDRT